ncbi:MAG: hypothetical protein ABSC25_00595 [Roseiarcus sp.]|jgi:hypothetical protein
MTKTDTRAAKRKYPGAATGEEGRFFAELSRSVPLSAAIKDIDFRFGEDSDGAPAVWITVLASADVNPSKEKIAELSRAAETLRAAVLNSEFKRWPYVQIKTE